MPDPLKVKHTQLFRSPKSKNIAIQSSEIWPPFPVRTLEVFISIVNIVFVFSCSSDNKLAVLYMDWSFQIGEETFGMVATLL